jgi:hypothetical protein
MHTLFSVTKATPFISLPLNCLLLRPNLSRLYEQTHNLVTMLPRIFQLYLFQNTRFYKLHNSVTYGLQNLRRLKYC